MPARRPSRPLSASARRLVLAGATAALLASSVFPGSTSAASVCSSTTGPTGYTVSTCLAPSSGTVSGTIKPTLTVTISSTTSRPSTAAFCLDGSLTSTPSCLAGGPGYLLQDFKAQGQPSQTVTTWSFSLKTSHWIDGVHALTAAVTMRDGTRTTPVSGSLTFSNGVTMQPKNGASPKIHTGTVPASGQPLIVAAVGDGAAGDGSAAAVASLVKSLAPNLFLYLGDVYQDGSYEEFADWYNGTFGSFKGITDPVIGNHEYLSAADLATSSKTIPAGVAYFDYWNNLPNYYSFNAGGWHFIALNANSAPMGSTAWNAELGWLSSDLAANAGKCTIAYWHQPAFNIGQEPIPGSSAKLWQLVAGHATLVLNGHDHTYQRWTRMNASGTPVSSGGTVEIVDGTGGHVAGKFTTSDPRVVAGSTSAGTLRLALSSSSAAVSFLNTAGTTLDSTSVPCVH